MVRDSLNVRELVVLVMSLGVDVTEWGWRGHRRASNRGARRQADVSCDDSGRVHRGMSCVRGISSGPLVPCESVLGGLGCVTQKTYK